MNTYVVVVILWPLLFWTLDSFLIKNKYKNRNVDQGDAYSFIIEVVLISSLVYSSWTLNKSLFEGYEYCHHAKNCCLEMSRKEFESRGPKEKHLKFEGLIILIIVSLALLFNRRPLIFFFFLVIW